jgi:2-alkenal reductase
VIRDVITEVDGKLIHSMQELASNLDDTGIGKQVTLTIERDGQTRTVKVTIADTSQLTQG